MPIYSYHCPNCKVTVEQMRSIAERDEPSTCATCTGDLARQIDSPGMVWAPTSSTGGHRV